MFLPGNYTAQTHFITVCPQAWATLTHLGYEHKHPTALHPLNSLPPQQSRLPPDIVLQRIFGGTKALRPGYLALHLPGQHRQHSSGQKMSTATTTAPPCPTPLLNTAQSQSQPLHQNVGTSLFIFLCTYFSTYVPVYPSIHLSDYLYSTYLSSH